MEIVVSNVLLRWKHMTFACGNLLTMLRWMAFGSLNLLLQWSVAFDTASWSGKIMNKNDLTRPLDKTKHCGP